MPKEKSNFRILFFLICSLFSIYSILIVFLHTSLFEQQTVWHDYYTDSYGSIAALGGITGFIAARKWGGLKSIFGRSLLLFSTGLFFQFLGQVSFGIYHYVYNIDIPYPSFGEIFYYASFPIYILATIFLARVVGSTVSLKSLKYKTLAVVIPTLMMIFSYWLLLRGYNFSNVDPLIIILDFSYPLIQAIFVSFAIVAYLTSRDFLGGIMKNKVLFLMAALVMQYAADTTFFYSFYNDLWCAAGISDYLYVVAYSVMGLALANFGNINNEIKKISNTNNND